ncbi:AraC family transcriptional regulator [Cohnella silvisoli]|uniref:AraC family transcriptional regulator n=1 Tax=Cohnella silvisoli TaxID=2873699 RepID=A0ABV1KS97_9BACL|nr:AraC family transcriptional regulator [Cohnella silvisoli]MCD9022574.1 AraC family transcriptional regulator [Cohnella silvisoli]
METIKAVQNAIDYMEDHLCERMELDRIAEAAYMSLPNLYRVFYALTGHPLVEYIRKRRINRAAVGLRHLDSPILDIALECGFDSYRTFAAVFKKNTGMTPGMYRKTDVYYSFERICLLERVGYAEDRELSLRFSDVKVIRVSPMRVIAYHHASLVREGLEEEAFRVFYEMLMNAGFQMEKTRIWGYDDPEPSENSKLHHYVMMAPLENRSVIDYSNVAVITLPGGLYAVSKVPAGPTDSIIAAWNRLLAEWLPRSNFKLGNHPFVEEFQHHHGQVNRLKLLLPVTRKQEQTTIGISELPSKRVLSFRSTGLHCQSAADDLMTIWLMENGLAGDLNRTLFMSNSYGIAEGHDSWYELAISVADNDNRIADQDIGRMSWLDEGLYAHMTTDAYGVMTGVLDMLYEWLSQNDEYQSDDQRKWFAKYSSVNGADVERSASVTCYIPVLRKMN